MADTVTRGDVLTRAASILEEGLWGQGGLRKTGIPCAVDAVTQAGRELVPELPFADVTRQALLSHGHARNPAGIFPLALWNDAPGRTKAEVVAELRRLAEATDA